MYHYRAAGLTITSDVCLPGFRVAPAAVDADVIIRRGEVPPSLTDAEELGPTWEARPDRLLLRIPGAGRFLVRDQRFIEFEPEHQADESDLAAFLGGSVFGVLLHQRRHVVLHASAVRVGDTAVLFSGRSGAGKSTLAAALAAQGLPLLADDQCLLQTGADGRLMVHSDGRMLKLWEQALRALDLGERRGEAVRNRIGKFYVTPQDDRGEPLAVGPVYMINDSRHRGAPEIETLNVVDAARAVVANAYRPQLVRRMNQRPAYLEASARLGAGSGVYRLRRRMAFEALDETIASLRAHWAELGIDPL